MSKIFYVDSENVGDEWIKLLDTADNNDRFLIFYTARSPHISYPNVVKLLATNRNLEFILCHEGSNALDFQLVSYLGYQLCREPEHEMYIVSKDTGYDAIIRFWGERNITIRRISSANCNTDSKTTPVTTAADAITAPVESVEDNSICGISKDEIDDIIAACPGRNPTYLHMFLTHFYGSKTGLSIYKTVTSKEYPRVFKNRDSKNSFCVLCQYIAKYSEVTGVTLTDDVIDFLYIHRTNPGNIPQLLQKQYGMKRGGQYRKMFKPFFKSLAKI